MNERHRNLIGLSAMFAALMTVFLCVFWQASHGAGGVLSDSEGNVVYYVNSLLFVPGFSSFALACRVFRSDKARRALTASVLALFALGAASLYAFRTPFVYTYVAPATVLLLCHVAANVFYRLSCAGRGSGCALGLGFSVGIASQYFLQGADKALWPLLLVVGAAFAALCFFVLRPLPDLKVQRSPGGDRSVAILLACAALVTLCMFVVISYYNGYVHELSVKSGFAAGSVMSWPRLVLIPAYLIFGFVGEVRDGKYVPLTALLLILLAVPGAVHVAGEGAYYFDMCLFYVGIAAANSYLHLTFWRLAPRTARPRFWASVGRMIDGVMTGVTGLIGFSSVPAAIVLVIDVLCLAAIITALVISGSLPSRPREAAAKDADERAALSPAEAAAKDADGRAALSPADAIDAIKDRCSLTAQERDVLSALVLTEDKQDAVAASLGISVNTLRHHVTSIYKKTGVQTRAGLTALYRDTLG